MLAAARRIGRAGNPARPVGHQQGRIALERRQRRAIGHDEGQPRQMTLRRSSDLEIWRSAIWRSVTREVDEVLFGFRPEHARHAVLAQKGALSGA